MSLLDYKSCLRLHSILPGRGKLMHPARRIDLRKTSLSPLEGFKEPYSCFNIQLGILSKAHLGFHL